VPPNCKPLFGDLHDIRVIVVKGIEVGDEMTVSYLPCDWESLGAQAPHSTVRRLSRKIGDSTACASAASGKLHVSRARSSSVKTNVANAHRRWYEMRSRCWTGDVLIDVSARRSR
jgi:hypothetical protein